MNNISATLNQISGPKCTEVFPWACSLVMRIIIVLRDIFFGLAPTVRLRSFYLVPDTNIKI